MYTQATRDTLTVYTHTVYCAYGKPFILYIYTAMYIYGTQAAIYGVHTGNQLYCTYRKALILIIYTGNN